MAADDSRHPNPNRWWKHRRRLAYMSMFGLYVIVVAMLVGSIREAMVPLAETLCYVFAFTILNYFGGNAWETFVRSRQ